MGLQELLEKRDAIQRQLDELLASLKDEETGEERDLTPEEEQRSTELVEQRDEVDRQIADQEQVERRAANLRRARETAGMVAAQRSASVTSEPRVYGEDSPHSHYADIARTMMHPAQDRRHQEAAGRLGEWEHQVEREIHLGTKEGRAAIKQLQTEYREGGTRPDVAIETARQRGSVGLEEKRTGMTTGGGATASASGGSGAAFVSPVFFLADYAPWREYGRAFADQCSKQGLPDYGMDVYIPAVTGPAGVASQTEGSGVNETDPTAGYLSTALSTLAGQVVVSQQLLDRAGPGFSFDRMVFDQLNRDYAPKLDVLVLTGALANAGAVTYTSASFSVNTANGAGGFYSKVSGAKSAIRTTAGTVLNPTHLFLQPSRWEFIAAWADGQARPLVVPDYAGAVNAAAAGSSDGDEGIEGNTGYRLNGLRVFTDANIPTPGTGADQAVVADLNEVYVFEGNPVTRAVPQTLAGNLQVILQLYNYVGVIPRYQKAVQAISGTGMAAITF